MTMDGARGQVGIGERSYFQITIILWTLNVLLSIIKDPLGFHVNIQPANSYIFKSHSKWLVLVFYLGMAQSQGLGEVQLWTGEGKGVISRRRC